jgi:D-glycero-D-manno-heptose 1,7-bisphosphate phosphatase
MRPAAFIDRDGVINRELGHVHRIEDFHVLPGVVEGLRALAAAGYELVVVTNQAGIAKGLYTEQDYQRLTQHMRQWFSERGVSFAGIYHCPHHPEGRVAALACSCTCRKPEPGMLLQATRDLGLDVAQSILIGDSISDMEAARQAGVAKLILVNSGHALPLIIDVNVNHRCADLYEASKWLTHLR